MPKPNGTLYGFERAELQCARNRYSDAVNELKMHGKDPASIRRYEALERKAFANLMAVTTRFAGCR